MCLSCTIQVAKKNRNWNPQNEQLELEPKKCFFGKGFLYFFFKSFPATGIFRFHIVFHGMKSHNLGLQLGVEVV